MSGVIHRLAVGSLVLGLSTGVWAQTQAPPQRPPKAGASRKIIKAAKPSAAQPQTPVQPEVPAPPQPVAPPRPDQMPPTAPQVTYQNGQLSIVAQNSTLSSILAAVRARTGAQVEMPADTANDRVAVKLGPGNPRDVLASLLEGSRFDYIVLGSATDPNEVSQVIMTPRQGSGAAPAVAGAGQAGMMSGSQSPRPDGGFRGGAARPDINAEEDEPAVEASPQSAPPPQPGPGAVMPASPPPNAQAAPGPEQPQSGATGQQNPSQVKTPEQLLQELQRMQQPQQQPPRRPPQQQK